MVKPFDIRDITTVQRLSASGYPLAYETIAVEGINTLIDALRSYLSVGFDRNVALVSHDEHGKCTAFGIMEVIGNAAVMEFMSPKPDSDDVIDTWTELAEAFVIHAAEKGCHAILAEVPDGSSERDSLLQAGFSGIIHQDIYKLNKPIKLGGLNCIATLREDDKNDDPAIKILAMRVVPKLLQRSDLTNDLSRIAHRSDRGFVVQHEQELIGHISFRQGRRGLGLQVLFKPDLDIEQVVLPALEYAIQQMLPLTNKGDKPIYCTLPSYLSWVQPALETIGFGHVTSNVLMIKNTAARVKQPVWSMQSAKLHGRRLAKSGENAVKSDDTHAPILSLSQDDNDND